MSKCKKLKSRMSSFFHLANQAAVNHFRSSCFEHQRKWTDKQILARIYNANRGLVELRPMPTFRQPTTSKTGFYNVLRIISINSVGTSGLRSKDLCLIFKVKSLALTLRRLEGAKLIKLDRTSGTHEWSVTKLGKDYLRALEKEFIIVD